MNSVSMANIQGPLQFHLDNLDVSAALQSTFEKCLVQRMAAHTRIPGIHRFLVSQQTVLL